MCRVFAVLCVLFLPLSAHSQDELTTDEMRGAIEAVLSDIELKLPVEFNVQYEKESGLPKTITFRTMLEKGAEWKGLQLEYETFFKGTNIEFQLLNRVSFEGKELFGLGESAITELAKVEYETRGGQVVLNRNLMARLGDAITELPRLILGSSQVIQETIVKNIGLGEEALSELEKAYKDARYNHVYNNRANVRFGRLCYLAAAGMFVYVVSNMEPLVIGEYSSDIQFRWKSLIVGLALLIVPIIEDSKIGETIPFNPFRIGSWWRQWRAKRAYLAEEKRKLKELSESVEIGGVRVRVVRGDLAKVKADAVIVPHFRHRASFDGVGAAISENGGKVGLMEMHSLYEGKGNLGFGEVFLHKRGGGASAYLLNSVSVGAGAEFQFDVQRQVVRNALLLSQKNGLSSVATSLLGSGALGELGPYPSSLAILEGVRDYVAETHLAGQSRSVKEVTLVVWDQGRRKATPAQIEEMKHSRAAVDRAKEGQGSIRVFSRKYMTCRRAFAM